MGNEIIIKSSVSSEIIKAEQSKQLGECSYDEIIFLITYICVFLGLGTEKYPSLDSKGIIVGVLKKSYYNFHLDEVKLAFEYALQGKFDTPKKKYDLNLYGNLFSASYIGNVLNEFIKIKSRIIVKKTEEAGMTNMQRAECIFDIIKSEKFRNLYPETVAKLTEKPQVRITEAEIKAAEASLLPKVESVANEELIQEIMEDLEELYKTTSVNENSHIKRINYMEKFMTINEFIQVRISETKSL